MWAGSRETNSKQQGFSCSLRPPLWEWIDPRGFVKVTFVIVAFIRGRGWGSFIVYSKFQGRTVLVTLLGDQSLSRVRPGAFFAI